MLQADREVDARGLNCPLPILRTKKALNDMRSGQTIRITATDPASHSGRRELTPSKQARKDSTTAVMGLSVAAQRHLTGTSESG